MRISFSHKILAAILILMMVLVAGILFFFKLRTQGIARAEIEDRLALTERMFMNYQASIADKLAAINAYVTGNSAFLAYMVESIESGSTESIQDQFQEVQRFSGAEFMIVLDVAGETIVDTSDTIAKNMSASFESLITELELRAEDGQEPLVIDRLQSSGRLYDVVLAPLTTPDGFVAGFVVVGYEITDETAERIGGIANCDIAFLARRPDKSLTLAASYFSHQMGAAVMGDALATQMGSAEPGRPFETSVKGSPYMATAVEILAVDGASLGRIAILKSMEAELAPFQTIQAGMVLISFFALLVFTPISLAVARGVTLPVNRLVANIEAVREGEYDENKVEDRAARDEIGVMARAFKAMVRELREQQELIHFLEQAAQQQSAMTQLEDDPDRTMLLPQNELPTQSPSMVQMAVREAVARGQNLPSGFPLNKRYEIMSELGRGGMGVVYKVRDRTLDEVAAFKMLLVDSPSEQQMMIKETKLARKVTHRNVIRIYDLGDIDGVQYISMEFVTGETLKSLLKKVKRLPLGIGIRILAQVIDGLRAAHGEGVIHGDIKPENIMINTSRGEVKVMDFGISRIAKGDEDSRITGTPAYMSPEQYQGHMSVQSDIYSIGVMAFEMFTGQRPFGGKNMMEVMSKHMTEPPPSPSALNPDISAELEIMIRKALAKKPESRFPDLTAFRKALRLATA
ncbi:Non-specific serine/threonine protein kinase [Sulfidibacter corallicola]|uniref:mitogen-activated protein kinase kinase n=1 Tax=Sulfidibacter corallicola TaxID=2818388 RepID=A0A8A4TS89_SULCO|nr:serine/threonine-protein kinase [Sulfidibacter corallicola]QTD52410.1 protein kinase [Sulfidibacter corallicola]